MSAARASAAERTPAGASVASPIAVGLGCRAGCSPEQVLEVLQQALAAEGRTLAEVGALHTADFKQAEPALQGAAALLQKPLVGFSLAQLRVHAANALTQSARTLQRFGLPSIAETAALAGASAVSHAAVSHAAVSHAAVSGARGQARLLAARRSNSAVSCALAEMAVAASAEAER